MPSPSRLVYLQYIRAAAALSVLLFHVSMNVAVLAGFSTPYQFFNWNFGYYGVSAFFVLSGYLMSSLVAEGATPARFLAHRLLRIYPTYWLAAGTVLAIRAIAGSPLPLTSLLLLLPVSNPPSFTLAPLGGIEWSLVYEVFFYLLSAVFCFAPSRRWHAPALAAWLVVLLTLEWTSPYLTRQNVLHFHYRLLTANWHLPFVAGGLGYYLLRVLRPNVLWCLGGLGLLFTGQWQGEIGRARLTPFAFTAILLYVVERNKQQRQPEHNRLPRLPNRLGQRLGDYSYGIYLIHFPVAQWVAGTLKPVLPPSWAIWLITIACSLAAGCLVGTVDVTLYGHLRRWADRVLQKQQPERALADPSPFSLWSGLIAGLGLLMLAISLTLAIRSYTPLPVWDQWQFSLDLARHAGQMPMTDFWAQQHEHRLPLLRLLSLADAAWFSASNLLLYACLLLGHLCTAVLLVWLGWRFAGWRGERLAVWAGLVLALLFSPMQREMFTWAWQVSFILLILAAVGALTALLTHATADRPPHGDASSRWALAAAIGLGVLSWLSLAPGLAVAALLALFAWWLGLARKDVLLLAAAAFAGSCVYLWHYRLPLAPDSTSILKPALAYLSLGLPDLFALAGLAGWLWMLSSSARDRSSAAALFPAAMVFLSTFALATVPFAALSQAAEATTYQPMTHGYMSIAQLFWLGLAGYALDYRYGQPGSPRIRRGIAIAAAMALALVPPLVNSPGLVIEEQWRETQRSRALVAIASNVRETEMSALLLPQTGGEDWWPWRSFAESRHWSLFAQPLFRQPPSPPPTRETLPVCLGAIDVGSVQQLTSRQPPGLSFTGWAWDQYRQQPIDNLVVVDEQNRVVGYAQTSMQRSDVTAAITEIPDQRVGWQGYVPIALLGRKVHLLAAERHSLTCRLEPEVALTPAPAR